MKPNKYATGLMLLTMLGGCAASDPCIRNPVIGQPAILMFMLLYAGGCYTAQAIAPYMSDSLYWTATPSGRVQYGVYTSPDSTFSAAIPEPIFSIGQAGFRIHEQILPNDDYVIFASTQPGTPIYAIKVTPKLDREHAALSLAEFANLSMNDVRIKSSRFMDVPLEHVYQENIELNGKPAFFAVYRQSLNQPATSAQTPAPHTVYYLMYFIKLRNRAAVLSVAWPKHCPQCSAGPESALRGLDPQIKTFVDSFVLNPAD